MAQKAYRDTVDMLVSVKIDTGTLAEARVATDVVLGGQKDCTLTRSYEEVDVSNKTTGNNKSIRPGMFSWSIQATGFVIADDTAYAKLEEMYMNREAVEVKFQNHTSGKSYSGFAYILDFPIDGTFNQMESYDLTFTGDGVLTVSPSA